MKWLVQSWLFDLEIHPYLNPEESWPYFFDWRNMYQGNSIIVLPYKHSLELVKEAKQHSSLICLEYQPIKLLRIFDNGSITLGISLVLHIKNLFIIIREKVIPQYFFIHTQLWIGLLPSLHLVCNNCCHQSMTLLFNLYET